MLEQLGNALAFRAFFTGSKIGAAGLTVTVDVYDPANTQIVTAAAATEIGGGLYGYTLASGSVDTVGEYLAIFKTASDDVDLKHVPSAWVVGRAGIEHLDAAISSRNATAPPTVEAVAAEVRAELTVELARIDVDVSSRNATAPPTVEAVAAEVRAELAVELARIDVDVSSRNATEPATVEAVAAEVRAELAVELARIDVDVSSRNATTPPTVEAVAAEVREELAVELARIDVDVSSRNATEPPSAEAVAAEVREELAVELDRIDVAISTRNATAPPSVASIVDAVLDETAADHNTAGSVGAAILAAGNAGDPWATTDLDAYPEDSAGRIFAKLNIGAPDDPVLVTPGAPADQSLCRVYGYFENAGNAPAAKVKFTFTLMAPGLAKSERGIVGKTIAVSTDDAGLLQADLQRNDLITPEGTFYKVTCAALNLEAEIELTAETFNLLTLFSD